MFGATVTFAAHPSSQVYWLNVFRESLRTHFECGGLTDSERMGAGVAAMESVLESILAREGRFDTIDLDLARQAGLRAADARCVRRTQGRGQRCRPGSSFPEVLHHLDAAPDRAALEALIFQEMLAGNWFDMGTVELVEAWRAAGGDVRQGHQQVPERPWRWDDVEVFSKAVVLDHSPVVILLDNAGPDTIFGAFSFARSCCDWDGRFVLQPTMVPRLNDVEVHDLPELIARATQVDAIFGALEHGIVNTGSSMPLS